MTATRFPSKRQIPSAIASATVVLPVPPLKLMAAMTDFGNSVLDIAPFSRPCAPSQRAAQDRETPALHKVTSRWRAGVDRLSPEPGRSLPGPARHSREYGRSALFRFPPYANHQTRKAVRLRVSPSRNFLGIKSAANHLKRIDLKVLKQRMPDPDHPIISDMWRAADNNRQQPTDHPRSAASLGVKGPGRA